MGEDRYLDAVGVCGDEMVEDLGVECPPQLAVAWARTHQVGYGRRACEGSREVALMGKELWERVRLDDAIVTRLGHLRSAAKQGERGR